MPAGGDHRVSACFCDWRCPSPYVVASVSPPPIPAGSLRQRRRSSGAGSSPWRRDASSASSQVSLCVVWRPCADPWTRVWRVSFPPGTASTTRELRNVSTQQPWMSKLPWGVWQGKREEDPIVRFAFAHPKCIQRPVLKGIGRNPTWEEIARPVDISEWTCTFVHRSFEDSSSLYRNRSTVRVWLRIEINWVLRSSLVGGDRWRRKAR